MIDFLCSNYPPLNIPGTDTFEHAFFKELRNANELKIASGYISNDSIADLIALYKDNLVNVKLDLVVGMHYFEGFTRPQYNSLITLSEILKSKNLGSINVAVVSKYHGKLYSFFKDGSYSTIIGSSNISRISSPERVYETDVIIHEQEFSIKVSKFINDLCQDYCKNITEIESVKIIENNKIFDNHSHVDSLNSSQLIFSKKNITDLSFNIKLKDAEKSNLNAYFGKGRQSPSGLIIPRNWYEVELIVSKSITEKDEYPKKGKVFKVITDDGYSFNCKTSGDYSKNFRSSDDLKILGMWIKGRLENNGCLDIGEKVTQKTFSDYGRDTITLTKTAIPDTWFLDFGV